MSEIQQAKDILRSFYSRYPSKVAVSKIDDASTYFINDVQHVGLDRVVKALKYWGSTERHFPDPLDIIEIAKKKFPFHFEDETSFYNRCKHAWVNSLVVDEVRQDKKVEYLKSIGSSYTTMWQAWNGFFQFLTKEEREMFNARRKKIGLVQFREYSEKEIDAYRVEQDKRISENPMAKAFLAKLIGSGTPEQNKKKTYDGAMSEKKADIRQEQDVPF